MEYSQEIRRLAETLKSSGLAASREDALEMARSMLTKKEELKVEEAPVKNEADMTQTTLSDLGRDRAEDVIEDKTLEGEEELKEEEVFAAKADSEQRAVEEKQDRLKNKLD